MSTRAKLRIAMAVVMGSILLLACAVTGFIGVFPSIAPALSRQIFSTPDRIWGFYVDLYNTEYRGNSPEAQAEFQDILAVPFAPGAVVSLDDWVEMREVLGKITHYTLTVGPGDEGYVLVETGNLGKEDPKCFRIAFLDGEEGYLIRRLAPCGRGP